MDQSGGPNMPPPGQTPPPPPGGQMPPPPPPPGGQMPPPPPAQNWQSTPQPPGAPPMGSGMPPATAMPGPLPGTTIADFVTRVVAFIIDSVIIGVVRTIVGFVFALILVNFLGGLTVVLEALAIVAISAVYFIYMWTTRRQTVGMQVMKLLVVQDGTGAALTQPMAIRRWIWLGLPLALASLLSAGLGFGYGFVGLLSFAILLTLIPIVGLLGLLWEIYLLYATSQDPRKQGPHDKAAGSIVISYGPSPFGSR